MREALLEVPARLRVVGDVHADLAEVEQPDRLADPVAELPKDAQRLLLALARAAASPACSRTSESVDSVAAMSTGLPIPRRSARHASSIRCASA